MCNVSEIAYAVGYKTPDPVFSDILPCSFSKESHNTRKSIKQTHGNVKTETNRNKCKDNEQNQKSSETIGQNPKIENTGKNSVKSTKI